MNKKLILTFFLLSSFLICSNIYFWTDKNGVKHFSNIAPPLDEKVQIQKEYSSFLSSNKNQKYKVLKVYDGDTIKVETLDLKFKIRLVGIDSPEHGFKKKKDQPFAKQAKTYLYKLLNNKNINIKSHGIGGYNRILAEVFINNTNINLEMIKSGMAEVYKGRLPKTLNREKYIQAEIKAKTRKKGIWAQGETYKSPKTWRKENPRE